MQIAIREPFNHPPPRVFAASGASSGPTNVPRAANTSRLPTGPWLADDVSVGAGFKPAPTTAGTAEATGEPKAAAVLEATASTTSGSPSGGPVASAPGALGVGNRRDILIETRAKHDTAATVAVASISEQDWYISRTHGVYHIPACPKVADSGGPHAESDGLSRPYALLLLTSRGDVIDLGDNRRFPFTISAREIAEDLLQDLHDHGVFVCEGARPTSEELSAATARRDAYYHRLIGEGDVMWARGHSFREISDLHRRAALALGVEREWAYVPTRMNECPACGEKVKAGVAVCKHCGAILDAEKAAQHGLGPGAARKDLVR